MKVQTQGPGECWLATACMLADYPLQRMRREIVERFGGRSWAAMVAMKKQSGHTERRNRMARFVAERLGIPQLLEVNWGYGTTIKRGPAPKKKIPPGRGAIILVRSARGRKFSAHLVAFEDGMVYDPSGHVVGVGLFNALYKRWRIEKVVQIPRAP